MANIELPKDAEGREIPLDTKVLYNEDGKCFKVNRFTYSVVQTMPGLKWGVVFMDCRYDYCSSFYLTPPETPDSWEKLEEDVMKWSCSYFGIDQDAASCDDCPHGLKQTGNACWLNARLDMLARAKKLAGIEEGAQR